MLERKAVKGSGMTSSCIIVSYDFCRLLILFSLPLLSCTCLFGHFFLSILVTANFSIRERFKSEEKVVGEHFVLMFL